MIERKFIYSKEAEGSEFHIYFIKDEKTGKRRFYTLQEITENPQRIEELKEELIKPKLEYRTQTGAFVRENKDGKTQIFETNPCSMMEAGSAILKLEGEKVLDKIKNLDDVVIKSLKDIKDSKTAKAVVALLLATTIGISSVAVNFENWFAGNKIETPQTGPSIVETIPTNPTNQEGLEMILPEQTPPTTSPEEVKPENSENSGFESPQETPEDAYINLDTITWETYKSSSVEFLEVADALKIAEACYNNLKIDLKKSNHAYKFDVSKFNPEMYVGEAIAENSLKYVENYVNQYGCRGMLMIGPAAMKEANEVAKNLTGSEFISDSSELDDPVKAFMMCMYISVRNYEYCADVVGAENVTPEMVFDCYLWGCGNVRSWLRDCKKAGVPYKAQTYSKKILYYGECLESYNDLLKQGVTQGEHDKYWTDLHVNNLWKLPNFNNEVVNEKE